MIIFWLDKNRNVLNAHNRIKKMKDILEMFGSELNNFSRQMKEDLPRLLNAAIILKDLPPSIREAIKKEIDRENIELATKYIEEILDFLKRLPEPIIVEIIQQLESSLPDKEGKND